MGTALHVKEGDVFAGRVKDGRFGAVRVLRVTKDGARKGRDRVPHGTDQKERVRRVSKQCGHAIQEHTRD